MTIRGTHTPGNWSFDEGSGEITSDLDEHGFLEHGFLVATVESNDADGPVLAAASLMLETLVQIALEVEERQGHITGDTVRRVVAAIEKAKPE